MRTWKEMKTRLAQLEKQNEEFRSLAVESKDLLIEAQDMVHEKQQKLVEARMQANTMAYSAKDYAERMKQAINLLSIMELPKNPLDCLRREYILATLRGEQVDLYRLLSVTEWTPVDVLPAVSPQPMGAVIPTIIPVPEPLYSVLMTKLGDKKINVIKVIREYTGLGLKEAKDLAEMPVPVLIKVRVSKDFAKDITDHLRMAGAEAEIREA